MRGEILPGTRGTRGLEDFRRQWRRGSPVSIPNTEVKPFSADGTWLETARKSRSPPVSNLPSVPPGGFFMDTVQKPPGMVSYRQFLKGYI